LGAQTPAVRGASRRPAAPPAPRPVLRFDDVGSLLTLGDPTEERLRLAHLVGGAPTAGYLLRTPSSLAGDGGPPVAGVHVTWLAPSARLARNSALPTADLDGALWAGRGLNVLLRGGARVRAGRFTVVVAPEIGASQNLGFQTTASGPEGQFPATGPYTAPWFTGAYSVDLPLRFGDQRYVVLTPGQSAAYVAVGGADVGVTTENEWWGPGARNALLLSNAGEGVPRLFARTRAPVRTGVGDFEARYFLGTPTASIYAAPDSTRDRRTLSGAAVTLRLRADTNLTLGVGRLVLAPRASSGLLGQIFDPIARNQNLGIGDTLAYPRRADQLTSVFTRWVLPRAHAEVYGEFARSELPRSLRDFLTAPQHTAAYTLGLARAWPLRAERVVRLQAEVTNLEQTRVYSDRPPPPDYYTGRSAPAGFTNRGQVLGAPIGPGSSGQWLAVDYYTPRGQAGTFLRRTRNQNDALYRVFLANLSRHDVTLAGGVRGGLRLPGVDARAELTLAKRLNYLYQNGAAYTFQLGTVDVSNLSLAVDLTPRARRRAR
jgi:hypothetical protein